MPSLEGAQEWLDRTEEHLQDLKAICCGLVEAECDAMIGSIRINDVDVAVPSYKYTAPTTPIPSIVRILAGESVQALRRCLDYLVYEVAWLDSGVEQRDTQFPIDDHPDRFKRRLRRSNPGDHACHLIGVAGKHAAAIKLLQPFKGVDWTETLRSISNPDKHRHLTMAKSESSSKIAWHREQDATAHMVTRVAYDSFTFLLRPDEGLGNVYMKFHVTAYVALEKGVRLIDTLDQLKAEVADVLEDFAPCFDGKCRH